jgi:hypothetical protein
MVSERRLGGWCCVQEGFGNPVQVLAIRKAKVIQLSERTIGVACKVNFDTVVDDGGRGKARVGGDV